MLSSLFLFLFVFVFHTLSPSQLWGFNGKWPNIIKWLLHVHKWFLSPDVKWKNQKEPSLPYTILKSFHQEKSGNDFTCLLFYTFQGLQLETAFCWGLFSLCHSWSAGTGEFHTGLLFFVCYFWALMEQAPPSVLCFVVNVSHKPVY